MCLHLDFPLKSLKITQHHWLQGAMPVPTKPLSTHDSQAPAVLDTGAPHGPPGPGGPGCL